VSANKNTKTEKLFPSASNDSKRPELIHIRATDPPSVGLTLRVPDIEIERLFLYGAGFPSAQASLTAAGFLYS
jgi:hypothetical protein